jgi:SulP family sulfate permease
LRVFKECQNLPKRLDLIGILPQQQELVGDIETIKAPELWAQLHDESKKKAPIVIDVREPREYRRGHIPQAQSVPLPQVAALDSSLDKDQPIVFVCRTSRRSHRAACTLISEGHTNVVILEGGMLAWESAGLLEAIDTFAVAGDN